jgi:hypothetical protein
VRPSRRRVVSCLAAFRLHGPTPRYLASRTSANDPLDIRLGRVRFGHAADLERACQFPAALEARMATWNLGAAMEHQARVLLTAREEADQVTSI